MIRIAWEEGRDRAWLARLVRSWGLDAAVGRAREGWEVLVCRDGSVRAAGQLITCGNDPRCTLTISSTLQKGGLAALQREIRTLAGRPCPPQELSRICGHIRVNSKID